MKKRHLKSSSEAILEKKAKPDKRVKTSLYLNERLYKEFKAVCDDKNASASEVLEELISRFMS